jgi:hypothetical protein
MSNLIKIQNELKAPKNQFNKFGNYKYRNQEDILEAVKPLLLKYNCQLTLSDKLKTLNNVMFVEVTATFKDGEFETIVKAQAGIEPQKGMTLAQCFGSSSSYARKYALNGLFLIDDTKDDDSKDNSIKSAPQAAKQTQTGANDLNITEALANCQSKEDLALLYDSLDESEQNRFKPLFAKAKIKFTK